MISPSIFWDSVTEKWNFSFCVQNLRCPVYFSIFYSKSDDSLAGQNLQEREKDSGRSGLPTEILRSHWQGNATRGNGNIAVLQVRRFIITEFSVNSDPFWFKKWIWLFLILFKCLKCIWENTTNIWISKNDLQLAAGPSQMIAQDKTASKTWTRVFFVGKESETISRRKVDNLQKWRALGVFSLWEQQIGSNFPPNGLEHPKKKSLWSER